MFEAGFTLIQNYISTSSYTWVDLINSIGTPLATLGIGIFTIYTTFKTFSRTMLDNLDSKSEWRKTLFLIAGKEEIKIGDVYQLRAALRYTEKGNPQTYFDRMNVIMIKYCKYLIFKFNKNPGITSFTLDSQESIRVFARYLLKDHWEKNQIKTFNFKFICKDKYKNSEKRLCIFTLKEFNILNNFIELDNNYEENIYIKLNDELDKRLKPYQSIYTLK